MQLVYFKPYGQSSHQTDQLAHSAGATEYTVCISAEG